MERSRRAVLKCFGGVLASTAVSGCLGGGVVQEAPSDHSVVSSFYTLFDFTRNITGDLIAVENPVPAGQHGHGWEPAIDLLPSIVESDAFVYLDATGFQPWAKRVATEIEGNHADDVKLIDVLEGIDLLEYDGGHHREYDHDTGDHEYGSVAELELVDRGTDDVVAHHHFGHWHGDIPEIGTQASIALGARFVDGGGRRFPLGENEPYAVDARVEGEAREGVVTVVSHGDHVRLGGDSVGEVSVIFELRHDGDVEWESTPITVRVIEDEEDDPDRDHGLYDVKFFSDPVLAQTGVRNIRDGLIELDPDNEAVYTENAAAYTEQLDELHQRYGEELANREHDLVVLAGHDSFHYLGTRYGFEIHTPVGLSPDDEPSSGDIAAAVDLVEEHEIEYVLWDYFDGDRIANAIVSEADSAIGTEMVSAAESSVPAWEEAGFGDYIGQMEEINLPAFKKALGVER